MTPSDKALVRAREIVEEMGTPPGGALRQAREDVGEVSKPTWQDLSLQEQLVKHLWKKIAFNAGKHRMTGVIVSVDTRMHRVYIDVDSGLEPGVHSFIISRMSNFALLRV
jgi:hypothetical protein